MTAYSCRQASIPAIPSAAQPSGALANPRTAHRTNGAGKLQLAKIVPDKRPEERRQRHERRGRERHGLRIASPSAPAHKPPGSPTRTSTFWITSRADGSGKPVDKAARAPAGSERGNSSSRPTALPGHTPRPAGPSAFRRHASAPRTTGCNRRGPTTSRSEVLDSGGWLDSSRHRSALPSGSRPGSQLCQGVERIRWPESGSLVRGIGSRSFGRCGYVTDVHSRHSGMFTSGFRKGIRQ